MSKQCFQIIYWLESWEIPNPLSLTICMKIYCHWRHCTCCNHLLYSDYHLGKRRQQNYLQPCLQINIHVPAYYRTFHKHPNSKVQKPPSKILRFSLPSIIITIKSNKPWNTETHKTDPNPLITSQMMTFWTR